MKFSYQCSECAKEYTIEATRMVCPTCAALQKPNFPLRGILEVKLTPDSDAERESLRQSQNLFDFFPIEERYFPAIPVGNTPLWRPPRLQERYGHAKLMIKDDTCNPTSSYKDRASYLVAAAAKKWGLSEIVVASTGNAGSSMAGVGAAAGLTITIFLPKTAPKGKLVQSLQYGANVITVDGPYDLAYDLSMEYNQHRQALNRNTAYNPLTIEGKKSAALEIFLQMGRQVPDYVFVPTGDGVIIAGVFKGFYDLYTLGLASKIPRLICVQAEHSDAITRAFEQGQFTFKSTHTVADSICVDVPRNGMYALAKIKKHGGDCVRVSDEAILAAQKELSSGAGFFSEPAGATAFAGYLAYRTKLERDASIVLMVTGNGLKDVDSAMKSVSLPPKAIKSISEIL